jgi:hypothetical protein
VALHLDQPRRVTVRFAKGGATRGGRSIRALVVDVVIRGLLTGAGAALVIGDGDPVSVSSATALGVLALAAALVDWGR